MTTPTTTTTTTIGSSSQPGAIAGVRLPVASGADTRRVVWGLARRHRSLVAGGAAVLVVATLSSLAIPLLLGGVVDVAVGNRPPEQLGTLIGGLVVATLLQGILFGFGVWAVGRLGELVLAELREDVVGHALAIPSAAIEEAGTGDLVARACGDVDAVSEALREAIPEIIASALIISLTVVGLATLDWRLALAGLACLPIQVLATRWYLRRSRPVYAAERQAEGDRSRRVLSSVLGARTLRAYRREGVHLDAITDASDDAVGLALHTASLRSRFFSALNLAELVGLSAVLLMSFPLVRDDIITAGAATAAALYFYRLFDPVGALLSQLDTAQAAGAALARLVGVTTLPAPPSRSGTPVDRPFGVELRGVAFAYDGGREVLGDVDLVVGPGERVAIVGPSGAGKSTIAKLIAGVHQTGRGSVLLGDQDITELDRGVLGRLVTLVSQEIHVFAGPLADDLRLARPDAGEDELGVALDVVGATDWVAALPDGLATVVGDGGHALTPTQAQQVALARLVLADPQVAVLDEATAEAGSSGATALDAATTAAIAGRTAIVIAHRLTQATIADRIVVVDGGRVVESGTHDDLLAADGLYATLWSAWRGTSTSPAVR